MSLCGIRYILDDSDLFLSPIRVSADATIKEFAAQVNVTQTFINEALIAVEAMYTFPVPARAAVCSFTMIKEDGRRVLGAVQEKEKAKQTYNAAIAAGKTTSIAVEQTPDVFQICVGNIAPQEELRIELVYVTELTEDEQNNSIRFHLPTHIGARFGNAPPNFKPSATSKLLDINVSVELVSPITGIGSPSHAISSQLGPNPNLSGSQYLPFSHYAQVSLGTDLPLEDDFILTIQCTGFDAPRSLVEVHPTEDSIGVMLTLVPKFSLPERPQQEFIFLVDRSGSMEDGNRISAARKALIIMLRSLPYKNTVFQIASFGNSTEMLWPQGSQSYSQETLEEATKHVDSMDADFGGTEIGMALEQCFKAQTKDRPTNIVVLTDGDAWDLDTVFSVVKNGVEETPDTRVFCLGIGSSASTAMCQGIARAGRGVCIMVGDDEATVTGKVARLVKASRTPSISNMHIDWGRAESGKQDGYDFETAENNGSSVIDAGSQDPITMGITDNSIDVTKVESTVFPPVILHPPAPVQQTPCQITTFLPGFRFYAYAILRGKKELPKKITIRGTAENGATIELIVPATLSGLPSSDSVPPTIHALAAHRIIQEYADGIYDKALRVEYKDDALRSVVKAHVVRISEAYSVASSDTSFVAVDQNSRITVVGTVRSDFILPSDYSPDYSPLYCGCAAPDSPVAYLSLHSPAPMPVMLTGALSPWEAEDDPVKIETPKTAMDILEAVARMQAFDGSFTSTNDVIRVLGLEISIKNAFGSQKDVIVATALIVAYATLKLEEEKDLVDAWEGVRSKANDYLVEYLGADLAVETVSKQAEVLL